MSELAAAIRKIAEAISVKREKNILDWVISLAPFIIALASLLTTIVLSQLESKEKESLSKTSQMDAVSKVLVYLADTSENKNTMGLITLSTYGQDEIVTKFMKSGLFKKRSLELTGIYIATNSKDTTIQKQVMAYFTPRQIALQNAIGELDAGAKSSSLKENTGEFVKKYNSFSGLTENQPWAATFVSWCYNKNILFFKPSGSINTLEKYFKDTYSTFKTKQQLPEPGDIYFYNWHNYRAIGIVEYYNTQDNSLHGIEGNSNEVDNGVNYKVARVSFPNSDILNGDFVFARVKHL